MSQYFFLPMTAEGGGMGSLLVPMLLIFAMMYFLVIRPQKKREKEVQAMRSQLEIGDEIVTAGGIIGRVINIREDSLVIETGNDRSKIRIARWAVQTNNTPKEAPAVDLKKDKKERKKKNEE